MFTILILLHSNTQSSLFNFKYAQQKWDLYNMFWLHNGKLILCWVCVYEEQKKNPPLGLTHIISRSIITVSHLRLFFDQWAWMAAISSSTFNHSERTFLISHHLCLELWRWRLWETKPQSLSFSKAWLKRTMHTHCLSEFLYKMIRHCYQNSRTWTLESNRNNSRRVSPGRQEVVHRCAPLMRLAVD